MVYRCRDLGIFDDQQAVNCYKQISYKGWRKQEPLDDTLPIEKPIYLQKAMQLYCENGRNSKSDIVHHLNLSSSTIENICNLENGYLTESNTFDFSPTLK